LRYHIVHNSIELKLERLRFYFSKAEDLLRAYRETRLRCDQQRARMERQLARLRQTHARLGLQSEVDK